MKSFITLSYHVLYYTLLYYPILSNTVLSCAVLHYSILYYAMLYYTIILYDTILSCHIPSYPTLTRLDIHWLSLITQLGMTALYAAASFGNARVVEILIKASADLDVAEPNVSTCCTVLYCDILHYTVLYYTIL